MFNSATLGALPNTIGQEETHTGASSFFRHFIWIALALLLLSVFGLSENSTLDLLGRGIFYSISLSFLPVFAYYFLMGLRIPRNAKWISYGLGALFVTNLGYVLFAMNIVALTFLVQYTVIFCGIYIFINAGLSKTSGAGLHLVAWLAVSILGLYGAVAILDLSLVFGGGWNGGFANANIFGMFVFMLLCVTVTLLSFQGKLNFRMIVALLAVSLLLIYASKSRSSLVALGMFAATYYAWPFIIRRKLLSSMYFLAVFGLIWYLIYSGAERIFLPDFLERFITRLSREYEKNVDSGRSVIWNYALDMIGDKPILGWGTDDTTQNVLNMGLSFHNWYLTIMYHFGVVGMTLYIFILYSIWRVLCDVGQAAYARAAASSMVGMLMTQVYEVSLTQNNLNIGVVYWALFGLAVGRSARSAGGVPVSGQAPALCR